MSKPNSRRLTASGDPRCPTPRLLFTCEHGGNRVPREFAPLFRDGRDALKSHRGYDPGSLALAKLLARKFEAPLFSSTVTRLLVELNRSPGHRRLFSEFTASLDTTARRLVLERYYHPYRRQVEEWLEDVLARGDAALHVSVHSFTPELHGEVRRADVGFLYDPARPWETRLCRAWQSALAERRRDLRVRRNYPYLGKADGFTTQLRRRFAPDRYAGIELEVNQRWPAGPAAAWRNLQRAIADSLALAIEQLRSVPDETVA
jgi:predicted N-formylglutamate amidohydrolase